MINRSDYNYDLPSELIAQYPLEKRTASRLLVVNAGDQTITHGTFTDIENFLKRNDLLVLNNTKVIPARLFGYKSSGGKIECFIERILDSHRALAHIRASKSPKPGTALILAEGILANVVVRQDDLFELMLQDRRQTWLDVLSAHGQIPLPSYIKRIPDAMDHSRYQTVFASQAGAVAAPTAGLHFDEALLARLTQSQVAAAEVTLHVGAGTFQPVREENLDHHKMHTEYLEVSSSTCEAINRAQAQKGRVVAVGTTVVRSLETASILQGIMPYSGETDLFIRPGYAFKTVDVLLTNFHLPMSTLLMLVCAFGGYDLIMQAYREAVLHCYRFFSYGDAMLIIK